MIWGCVHPRKPSLTALLPAISGQRRGDLAVQRADQFGHVVDLGPQFVVPVLEEGMQRGKSRPLAIPVVFWVLQYGA